MSERRGWRRWLRAWRDVGSEVDDEIGFHLEMRALENEASGMDPASARRAAECRQLHLRLLPQSLPTRIAAPVRGAVHRVEADIPVGDVQPLARVIAESIRQPRLLLWLLGAFGGLSLVLGGIGVLTSQLYGVQPTDPLTYVAVSAVLGSVAVLAAWSPARRASRARAISALTTD